MTRNILLTTEKVQLLGKKEFAAAAIDPKHEQFRISIAILSLDLGDKMHYLNRA